MAETFAKKEKEKKRAKKKMEKAEKKEERKTNNNKGKTLEEMIAYVDEYGNITNVPPDKQQRKESNRNTEAYINNTRTPATDENTESTGIISLFFKDKGYGFITEDETGTSIFVHNNNLMENIRENDRVVFKKESSPKGQIAINVKKLK
ncbi:cold-shock protein [Pseudopedobacter beijingensis]|uniref:Cold-shock protein n=1 Tax=Pseudopedobacter beijingensis TaxID=1207056 RepID=A0ABW4I9H5_9SPHI